jgi:hypothetical protein
VCQGTQATLLTRRSRTGTVVARNVLDDYFLPVFPFHPNFVRIPNASEIVKSFIVGTPLERTASLDMAPKQGLVYRSAYTGNFAPYTGCIRYTGIRYMTQFLSCILYGIRYTTQFLSCIPHTVYCIPRCIPSCIRSCILSCIKSKNLTSRGPSKRLP